MEKMYAVARMAGKTYLVKIGAESMGGAESKILENAVCDARSEYSIEAAQAFDPERLISGREDETMYENDFDYSSFDYLAVKARVLLLSAEHDANQLADILTEDYAEGEPLTERAKGWLDVTYSRCINADKASENAYNAIKTQKDLTEYFEMLDSIKIVEAIERMVSIAKQHGYTISVEED